MDITDIPPPLSDRTLSHGRNLMTIAGIIIVLAWVPGWNLATIEPFGFKIDTTTALSIWCLLIVVLAYCTTRLIFGVQAELPSWKQHFEMLLKQFKSGDRTPIPYAIGRLERRAVWIDKSLPLLSAAFSLVVALSEVIPLL